MIVFLPMCADIIHIGHIKILKFSEEYGKITVLLMTDEAMLKYKRKSYMKYDDRKNILKQFKNIYNIIPCEGPNTYKELVLKYKPNYFIHGDDWKTGPQSNGRMEVIKIMNAYGGKVIEPEYTKNISSTMFNQKLTNNISYKNNIGILLRGVINDLKRTPSIIEKELNINENIIDNIINGYEHDESNINSIIETMYYNYPVMKSHLSLDLDNSINNCWLMKKNDTLNSSRIINRINSNNYSKPYYNYMDLSTSAISPFKPELIEQLVEVKDNNPYNPLVVMNKGHLMSQLTLFIGPVNYYYTINNETICKEMNTGDSCFIMPYVPHSFTSRDLSQYTAIVAVTFSGYIHNVKKDILHYDINKILNNVGDLRNPKTVILGKIERFCDLTGYNLHKLKELLIKLNFNNEDINNTLSNNNESYNLNILYKIADILDIPRQEFDILKLEKEQEVTIKEFDENNVISYNESDTINKVYPIAKSKHITDIGGYIWHFNSNHTKENIYYSFIYNYGSESIIIKINNKDTLLESGDSITIKPYIVVNYSVINTNNIAKLIIFKVPCSSNTKGVLDEYMLFAREGIKNINCNNNKWW